MTEVRRLLVLRAVAAHGSVTGAAGALSYSASAVSQQLSRLERELGVALVHRNGRRITMTPVGQELADRAGALIELADDFEARAKDTVSQRPRLRVASFPQGISWLLAPALAGCQSDLAGIDVEIDACTPDMAARNLRHGLVDLALTYAVEGQDGAAGESLAVVQPRLVAAARFGYPPPRVADCEHLPWVIPSVGSLGREIVERAFAAAGIAPDIAATATTLDGVAAIVESGLGISLLPSFAFSGYGTRLVSRAPLDAPARIHVTAALSRRSVRDLPLQSIVAAMRDVATSGPEDTNGSTLAPSPRSA